MSRGSVIVQFSVSTLTMRGDVIGVLSTNATGPNHQNKANYDATLAN
jgi:hypothetical protein